MKSPPTPPNWMIRFLEWFCPQELQESILGDLLERYDEDCRRTTSKRASFYFLTNVLRFFHPAILRRNHLSIQTINMSILKNYWKVALRSFVRQKGTTAINLIGLTLGISCAIVAYVFAQHEWSFDKFHRSPDKIYWFTTKFKEDFNLMTSPGVLAPTLVEEVPEVTESCRMRTQEVMVVRKQDFFPETAFFVDSNFFNFFTFELKLGDKQQLFRDKKSVVISEEVSFKYFGSLNPIGQTLRMDFQSKEYEFRVDAVAENPPDNSTLQYRVLLPLSHLYQKDIAKLNDNWTAFGLTSFVRIAESTEEAIFQQKLKTFGTQKYESVHKKSEGPPMYTFLAHAFGDFHLGGGYEVNGFAPSMDPNYIRILGIIGLLVLLVACLNFMNLSNAKSSKRLTEVGVRKVLGAQSVQLRRQFMWEAIILSLFSVILSLILLKYALPYVSNITGYVLHFNWQNPSVWMPLLGIAVISGVLAGIYPALVLSSFPAVQTFRSNLKIGGNNWATKGSLIFQFTISIVLFSSALLMYQQQQFIRNINLGFDKEALVVIPTQIKSGENINDQLLVERYKASIHQLPTVKEISAVSNSFHQGNRAQFVKEDDGQTTFIFEYRIDTDYLKTMGIELVAGRNFNQDTEEQKASVIVNETFLKKFQINQPIGYRLPEKFNDFAGASIVGVAKDYHYSHLREAIKPAILHTRPEVKIGHILVRIEPNSIDEVLPQLKKKWAEVRPEKPFTFSFLDEDIQRQYVAENRWHKVLTGATLLAILISCLGLFGLIALTLVERTKEIGIRKILGANLLDITWLISKQFTTILVVAAVIAVPISLYYMQQWLANFAYQIDVSYTVFGVASGIFAVLTFGIIFFQALRTAFRNPVEALAQE
ncbi:MAG: ABC transporter permease [Bacteroidota bacterium]